MTSSTEQTETVTKNTSTMDTSADIVEVEIEEKPVNGVDEEPTDTDNKAGKRKRPTKKFVEPTESISSGRPKRNLSKRKSISLNNLTEMTIKFVGEEVTSELVNGNAKGNKAKVEQTNGDADDEQERDKNIPVLHEVADVVWVKMGGHPW